MAKKILADTGFWIALFYEDDKYRTKALSIEQNIHIHSLLIPWPTLYETINTKASKQKHNVATAFSTSKSYLVVGMIAQVIRLT